MPSELEYDGDHGGVFLDPKTLGPSTKVKCDDCDCPCDWELSEEEVVSSETDSVLEESFTEAEAANSGMPSIFNLK
jgi:hypothetical protein